MEMNFQGKVALVTGGSFGIGQATALAFARAGARVIVADVTENPETMQSLRDVHSDCIFVKTDVSDSQAVRHLFDTIRKRFGQLDAAFNNAGIEGDNGVVQDCTESNWDKVMSINLKSAFLCMKEEIPIMIKQGKGAIVNCASVAGLMGFTGLPAYVASKHGMIGLTKAAALETAKQGIRINAVCPGVIHTAMVDRVIGGDKELEKAYINMEPVGRMGQPEEIAEAVLWLCSDSASFVTGQAIPVDGGMMAG